MRSEKTSTKDIKVTKHTSTTLTIFVALATLAAAPPKPESVGESSWLVDHIESVPPIQLRDPFLELLGQTNKPLVYRYPDIVQAAGHSCGASAGAWIITRKALAHLYPDQIPVRGQVRVHAPGAEDEGVVGVFGELISILTGAHPRTGFPGATFGPAFNRRNLMIYTDKPTGTPPPTMEWVFERVDTHARVGVRYDPRQIQPAATPAFRKMSSRVARGEATPEELSNWRKTWNVRVKFVFDNADTQAGLFSVRALP